MLFCALFAFGIFVGMLSGLLGIGGGIVLVPGLIMFFGLSQPEAQGTSLMVLSFPIVGFAAAVYYRAGLVHLPVAGMVALGFIVGALARAKLVPHVPIEGLRIGFGALLLYIGFHFVIDRHGATTKAILPSIVALALAWLFRRARPPRLSPEPPSSHTEYHI